MFKILSLLLFLLLHLIIKPAMAENLSFRGSIVVPVCDFFSSNDSCKKLVEKNNKLDELELIIKTNNMEKLRIFLKNNQTNQKKMELRQITENEYVQNLYLIYK